MGKRIGSIKIDYRILEKLREECKKRNLVMTFEVEDCLEEFIIHKFKIPKEVIRPNNFTKIKSE